MPATPYAQVRASINGGANQTGGLTVDNADTVDLSAASTAQWGSPAPEWQIYSFTSGFSVPAGWSTRTVAQPDGSNATIYYYQGVTPPQFTIPASPWWGKLMIGLYVNGGGGALTDEATALQVVSPNGLYDIAHREAGQFGLAKKWSAPVSDNWHTLETFMSTSSGQVVANIAALAALDDTLFADGTIVSVVSLLDAFVLKTTTALTADDITVVDANSATKQWVRAGWSSEYWHQQTTWYISSAGDDENTGLASGSPLATFAELDRRICKKQRVGNVTVYVLNNIDQDINWTEPRGTYGTSLTMRGHSTGITTLGTDTVSAYADVVLAARTITTLAGTTITDWSTGGPGSTSLVGYRVRCTVCPHANAHLGARAYICKDAGAGTAWLTRPKAGAADDSDQDLAAGDTFVVESFPKLAYGAGKKASFGIVGAGDVSGGLVLQDLAIGDSTDEHSVYLTENIVYFVDMIANGVDVEAGAKLIAKGSAINTVLRIHSGAQLDISGGYIGVTGSGTGSGTVFQIEENAYAVVQQLVAVRGATNIDSESTCHVVLRPDAASAGHFATIDSTIGLSVTNGGHIHAGTGSAKLFGSGITSTGVAILNGSEVFYDKSNVPDYGAPTTPFSVDGSSVSLNTISALTGSRIVPSV